MLLAVEPVAFHFTAVFALAGLLIELESSVARAPAPFGFVEESCDRFASSERLLNGTVGKLCDLADHVLVEFLREVFLDLQD